MHVVKARHISVIIVFGIDRRPDRDNRSVVAESSGEFDTFAAFGRAEDARRLSLVGLTSGPGVQSFESCDLVDDICIARGYSLVKGAADWGDSAHRAAEIKGERGRVQSTQLGHLIRRVEDHSGSLDEWKAKDGVNCYVGPACDEKGGRMPLTREVWHVELECDGEVGGDRCATLLDDPTQHDWIVVRRTEDRGNGMRERLCNGRVIVKVAGVKGSGSINNAADGGAF